jgi:hypothetical protein
MSQVQYQFDLHDPTKVRNHLQSLFDVGHLWERTCTVEEEISGFLADLFKAGWNDEMVATLVEWASDSSHYGFRHLQMGRLVAKHRI